jgi:hypothetical protein
MNFHSWHECCCRFYAGEHQKEGAMKVNRYFEFAFLALLFLVGAGSAHASVILVTSPAALGANDSIDWGQLGPSFTSLTSPQSVVSGGGLNATVSSSGGVFERRDQGNGWNGNFAFGTPLLWTTTTGGPDITVTFATPVSGAGAQIQADFFGDFTAQIILNGGALGTFTENGTSNGNNDNSAIFIGALSSIADITTIEFSLTSAVNNPNDFAIGTLALNTTGGAVPEPSSLVLLGTVLAALAWSLRNRKWARSAA